MELFLLYPLVKNKKIKHLYLIFNYVNYKN